MKPLVPLLTLVLSVSALSTATFPAANIRPLKRINTIANDAIYSGRGNTRYGGGLNAGPNSQGSFIRGNNSLLILGLLGGFVIL